MKADRHEIDLRLGPSPKSAPSPFHIHSPTGIVTAPNKYSIHAGEPCFSRSPASPIRSRTPTARYAPLAIRQKPAKNFSQYAADQRRQRGKTQMTSGMMAPITGPAQLTSNGAGLTDKSVLEI